MLSSFYLKVYYNKSLILFSSPFLAADGDCSPLVDLLLLCAHLQSSQVPRQRHQRSQKQVYSQLRTNPIGNGQTQEDRTHDRYHHQHIRCVVYSKFCFLGADVERTQLMQGDLILSLLALGSSVGVRLICM